METDFDKMMQGIYSEADCRSAVESRHKMEEAERKLLQNGVDPLKENLCDVVRHVAYIANRVCSDQNLRDFQERTIHDTGFLIERRDAVVLNILREIEKSLCMGKGHHLIQWPSFEEMLNEQKKK